MKGVEDSAIPFRCRNCEIILKFLLRYAKLLRDIAERFEEIRMVYCFLGVAITGSSGN